MRVLCYIFHTKISLRFVFKYSIICTKDASSDALATAKTYYNNIEFAMQLCKEFADCETSNPTLFQRLDAACKALERIITHNPLLKSSSSLHQPAWPRHEALLRLDLPLHRLTTYFVVTKKWFPRFFCMRGQHLYFSSGKNGHPDTQEGTLAFMRSNPAPDGRYCVDLRGTNLCMVHRASSSVIDAQAAL